MTAEASCQANGTPVFDRLELWSSVTVKKTTAGRGSNGEMSPYGLQKLRELILELAVRGMLVPQHPNEEPVSDLLEKVDKEREELVQDGVFRKQTTLPNIERGEIPFDVPEGWRWVRIGRLGRIFNGNSISVRVKEEKYTNIEGGLPFIATKDIGYGWQVIAYENGISIPRDEPNFKVAHKGAVLICAEGGSAGKKCGITKQDICFGNKLFAVELLGNVVPNYLLVNFLSPMFFEQFTANMTGIIGGISLAKLKNLLIPLPPLAEQSRIVAKVDELMAFYEELEQQQTDSLQAHQTLVKTLLRTLVEAGEAESTQQAWNRISEHFDTLFTTEESIEQLKQTILQLAANGRLVPFGSTMRTVVVKDLLAFGPRNGFSPKEVAYETSVLVLKLGATSYGVLDLTESKYVDVDIPNDSHLWLSEGDILIQRGNSSCYVGSNVLIEEDCQGVIYPDLMMKVRADDSIEPKLLSLLLKAPSSREHMWGHMTGTSGTMPKISKKVVESVRLIFPAEKEIQRLLVAKIDELMVVCDLLKARIQDVESSRIHLADAVVEQAFA